MIFRKCQKRKRIKGKSMLRCLSGLMGVKVDFVMKTALKPRIGKHVYKKIGDAELQ